MTRTSASGEQAALGGYQWQYDQIAKLVYDAIREHDFVSLRLTDPNAGQADDLVLVRKGRTDAYQFKSGGRPVTFKSITKNQRTRSGAEAPSLVKALADAWRNLQVVNEPMHVHYFAQAAASVHDQVVDRNNPVRPVRNHFRAFLTAVLEPLHKGTKTLDEIDACWQTALDTLRERSGVSSEEFIPFLQSLHFDLNVQSSIDESTRERQRDLEDLSNQLYRLASEIDGVVKLTLKQLLTQMVWQDRLLPSIHNFPVSLDTYAPLSDAIEQLSDLIGERDRGYIAVVGPPGTGKSTLLAQTMSGTPDRVIPYYAYLPDTVTQKTRLTGHAFLHRIVFELKKSRPRGQDAEIPSVDIAQLRRQRAELFDLASQEFGKSGRRTIIAVDGLDHVEREYSGNDGLLSELPKVDELPEGVLLVVGTRMLKLLGPDARQNIDENNAIVDLSQHPLPTPAIREICNRAPGVSELGKEVHQRIVERSAGHPLSLSYLLNRLRNEKTKSAIAILESTPGYKGDISITYQAIWDRIEQGNRVEQTYAFIRIFAICSRLRIDFRSKWLYHILPHEPWQREIVQRFSRDFQHLFHINNNEWRFFHDSFRQFVVEHTAQGPNGIHDGEADADVHRDVAEFCSQSNDRRLAAEQLHHRYLGHQYDEVLALASQTAWRQQVQNLRSPSLVRHDIEHAMEVAADRADVTGLLRAMLSMAELQSRTSILEDIDLPRALYEGGLVDEALEWCSGKNPGGLLAHRYNLAWILGREGNAAGKHLFDTNEHHGFDEPSGLRVVGHMNDAALAWTRCAAMFRPISSVIQSIKNHLSEQKTSEQKVPSGREYEAWHRYVLMMQRLIDATLDLEDSSSLKTIDEVLAKQLTDLKSSDELAVDVPIEQWEQQIADIIDLSFRTITALRTSVHNSETVMQRISSLLSDVHTMPMFLSTMLDAAELLANSNLPEPAQSLLEHSQHKRAFTADDLAGDHRDEVAATKFRYWRLRYRLATRGEEVLGPIPQHAAMHGNILAIKFAERIDGLIRELARIDAGTQRGDREASDHVWAIVQQAIDVVPANNNSRAHVTRWGYSLRVPELLKTAADVATNYRGGLPQRLSDELEHRFREHSTDWLGTPLLDVIHVLKSADVDVTWEQEVFDAHEESMAEEDVYEKVEKMVALFNHYSVAGQHMRAAKLARDLLRAAFAVRFRKDYQFNEWIDWYSATLTEIGGAQFLADGSWLARILSATNPMTEGAPAEAAVELPAALVMVDPLAAVHTFEYLVRRGTVSHFDALAALVCGLVKQAGSGDAKMVALAGDITALLISAGATHAYPELAAAIVAAANRVGRKQSIGELALSIATLTDRFALSSTRGEWLRGLGLSGTRSAIALDSNYHNLILNDGRRITSSNAIAQMRTVNDILRMRQAEVPESKFPWKQVVQQQNLTSDDVRQIAPLFRSGDRQGLDVLVTLAEIAEQNGDCELALALATEAFGSAQGDTWARSWGGTRLRSAALRVRLGGEQQRIEVCRDLAYQVSGTPSLSSLLLHDLQEIVAALDPDLTKCQTWPLVREYLEGIAEPLDLGEDDPFTDNSCRWWPPVPSTDQHDPGLKSTPNAALSELVVGHLLHPSTIIADTTTTVIVHALTRGDEDIAQALARFAGLNASDGLLERAGRCLAAAYKHHKIKIPSCLKPLDLALAAHPSQILRDLASTQPHRINRALDGAYRLTLPAGSVDSVDWVLPLGDPYENAYRWLAQSIGLDLAAIHRVSTRYTNDQLATLAADAEIQRALEASAVEHYYLSPKASAQRSAFGRVLADFRDAGMLDDAPPEISRMLRTVDIDLVGHTPEPRPVVMPAPPPAGHDQTCKRWLDELEARLQAYIRASDGVDCRLIGAKAQLAILNWGYLEEEFLCGTTIGIEEPSENELFLTRTSMRLSDLTVVTMAFENVFHGGPLILENRAEAFHQIQADWLAFRPDLATVLGWLPVPSHPGRWLTPVGTLAAETVWWVDGQWGTSERAFDDTVATGHAVLITEEGIASIQEAFNTPVRHFRLTRYGREEGISIEPLTIQESMPL